MPSARDSIRGFDLNCRFAVKGIQKASRSPVERAELSWAFIARSLLWGLLARSMIKKINTNGLISLIEQNRVSPSVSSLKKVLDGIPMALADFFTQDLGGKPQVFFPREELADIGTASVELRLVGSRLAKRSMSILHERYAPNADTGEEMLTHAGEEGGVIVKGKIELTVGGESRVLGPGDAYYFKSSLPHRFRNVGREECEIVSANSPPTI
jgi:mannose-6-phosphate isomerase-like protein (cupin superfamily)